MNKAIKGGACRSHDAKIMATHKSDECTTDTAVNNDIPPELPPIPLDLESAINNDIPPELPPMPMPPDLEWPAEQGLTAEWEESPADNVGFGDDTTNPSFPGKDNTSKSPVVYQDFQLEGPQN